MSKITGFHHVAIHAVDFDRSIRFYTKTLGLAEKSAWTTAKGRAALIEAAPGSYVEIFERPPQPRSGHSPILHFCFRTDDVDGMTERARADGCRVTVEPNDVEVGSSIGPMRLRLAFIEGPDGEEIELMTSDIV